MVYKYDAFDRRVQKRVDPDGSGGPLGFAATDYVYSGDDLLLSRNALAQVTHRYLHAPGSTPRSRTIRPAPRHAGL